MKDNLDELSIPELESFKKELADYVKERVASEKSSVEESFRATVKVGDRVRFLYKDGELDGEVVKINEKTFTVEIDDGLKRPILFHRFIGKVEDNTEEAA